MEECYPKYGLVQPQVWRSATPRMDAKYNNNFFFFFLLLYRVTFLFCFICHGQIISIFLNFHDPSELILRYTSQYSYFSVASYVIYYYTLWPKRKMLVYYYQCSSSLQNVHVTMDLHVLSTSNLSVIRNNMMKRFVDFAWRLVQYVGVYSCQCVSSASIIMSMLAMQAKCL